VEEGLACYLMPSAAQRHVRFHERSSQEVGLWEKIGNPGRVEVAGTISAKGAPHSNFGRVFF